jgi:hypothetical protein
LLLTASLSVPRVCATTCSSLEKGGCDRYTLRHSYHRQLIASGDPGPVNEDDDGVMLMFFRRRV